MILLNEPHRSVEKNVGTESLGLDNRIVVQDHVVEVTGRSLAVGRKVCTSTWIGLSDASGTVNERLTESTIVGLVCIFIAQVPFPKNTRGITCLV